ncbi:MAG TPA: hypothetical protein VMT99_02845 [Candidatus Paceibacterota bacterium]|nr:hypothetical protein [Candidatus Paceibacterota bacterium]
MIKTQKKIGVIGLGFLGGSVDRYFRDNGIETLRYDKKGVGSPGEVNRADIVFVCVNTPFDTKTGFTDLSYVESAVSILNSEKVVVLRSTIPPGTTDSFQKKFPQHAVLFNPEFLRAATAYEDFINPPRQLIGTTAKSESVAQEILDLLPTAPREYVKIVPAREAELVKFASNTILASKVAIANKVYDFAQALEVDYDEIKALIGADPRIGHYGLEVMYEGFRGYNGTCFPKDVRTLIALGEKMGVDVRWLKDMDDENLALLRSQGLEPNYGYPKEIK